MEWVTVPSSASNQQELAQKLLAAADNELDVLTTSEGFRVPYTVARDAGLVGELYGDGQETAADLAEADFPPPGQEQVTVDVGEVASEPNTAVETMASLPNADNRGVADDVDVPWVASSSPVGPTLQGDPVVLHAEETTDALDTAEAQQVGIAEVQTDAATAAADAETVDSTEDAAEVAAATPEGTASDDVAPAPKRARRVTTQQS